MESGEVYFATRRVFAAYAAFFHEVAAAIGVDRALALHEQASARMGANLARTLAGPCQPPCELEQILETLLRCNRSLGIESEPEEVTPVSAVLRNGRCPVCDGYWMGGLDESTARSLCERGMSAKLNAAMQELAPRIEHCLKAYRTEPESSCLQEIVLR